MKLLKLKNVKEYRPTPLDEYDVEVNVKHYIVELNDSEYKKLLELTKGQER